MIDFNLLKRPDPMQGIQQVAAGVGQMKQQHQQALQQEKAAADEARRKADYMKAFNVFMEDSTVANGAKFLKLSPQKDKEIAKEIANKMLAETKQNILTNKAQGLSAVENDYKGAGITWLQNNIDAFEAKGNNKMATMYGGFLNKLKSGDSKQIKEVANMLMIDLQSTPGGADYLEAKEKQAKGKRDAVTSDIDNYVKAKNVDVTSKDAVADTEFLKSIGKDEAAEFISLAGKNTKGTLTQSQYNSQATTIRKEYNAEVGSYKVVSESADKIRAAAKEGTGFGTSAMVVLFNKVLDPPSVVRESEAARTENSVSILSIAGNLLNKLNTGETLGEDSISELIRVTEAIEQISIAAKAEQTARYDGIATRAGINTKDVTGTGSNYGKANKEEVGDSEEDLKYRETLIAQYGAGFKDILMSTPIADLRAKYGNGTSNKTVVGDF